MLNNKNVTIATWHPPRLTKWDYDNAQQNSVLCIVSRPCGRGKARETYEVVPIDYTHSGNCYFCIDDGVVVAWTHLPQRGQIDEEETLF